MDLLDRLLGHDCWTTTQLLSRCHELTDEQLDREFDIGPRSVRATLEHVVRNVEVWTDLMAGQDIRPDPRLAKEPCTIESLTIRLDHASAELATLARGVADREGWDERWLDVLEDPPRGKTFGGAIAHILTHSMHHRAQLLYMMRKLGVEGLPEGDALSWENRKR